MKQITYLIFLICFIGVSQNSNTNEITCDLLPSISSNSKISFHLSEISKEEYERLKNKNPFKIEFFENSDSIENILLLKFPKLFFKEKDTLIVKSDNTKSKFRNNLVQEKSYSDYAIKGKFKDYYIILENLYESTRCTLINVKTNKAYSLPNNPTFVNENFFYGYSFGLGDGDIKIIDVINNEEIYFMFSNLYVKDSYNLSNHIRFEVQCMNSNEIKYLEILK